MLKSSRVSWLWFLLPGLIVVAVLVYRQWLQPSPLPGWGDYKKAFISTEGAVADSGNHGVSHSESQGYGLLFAFHSGDRKSFRQIWQWSQKKLQVRNDHLFAWRYVPGEGVKDLNNASDGDMLIAWALIQAGERWGDEAYLNEARQILKDLRGSVMRQWQGQTIVLPGQHGFEHDGVYTVNLSYWLFAAFHDFQRIDPAPEWLALDRSGRALIAAARFGEWQLPPDWLQLGAVLQPATDRPPRYGYDAIRVPLNLIWGGVNDPALLQPFSHFQQSMVQRGGHLPSWVDLTNNQLGEYDAPAGIKAVYGLLANAPNAKYQRPEASGGDYYSSSLILMVELASQ